VANKCKYESALENMTSDLIAEDKKGLLTFSLESTFEKNIFIQKLTELKLYLFETFYFLFKSEKETSGSKNYQKSKFLFLRLLVLLQWLSFLWVWNMQLSSWTDYRAFWRALSYARFDTLCAEYNTLHFCTYFSLSLVVLCYSGLLLVGVLIYHNQKSPQALGFVLKGLLQFVCEVGYVPMVTLLLIVSKYTLEGETKVEEYFGEELESIRMSRGWAGAGIGGCLMLGVLKYLFVNLTTETRHCYSHHNITSKVSAKFHLYKAVFDHFLILSYIVFSQTHINYVQVYSLLIGVVLFIQLVFKIPYYSPTANKLEAYLIALFILQVVLFQLCNLMDSAGVLFVLTIFVPIAFIVPVFNLIEYRYKLIQTTWSNLHLLETVYDLELRIRSFMLEKDPQKALGEELLQNLCLCFDKSIFKGHKMLSIWTFHLCKYVLKDRKLALIKLSQSIPLEGTLEDSFQEFISKKSSKTVEKECECLEFLCFIIKVQQITQKDKTLSLSLLDFWNEITSAAPTASSLEPKISKLCKKINNLKQLYTELIENYSKFEEVFQMYGSYLENLLFDPEKALVYYRKAETTRSSNAAALKDSTELKFYDKRNGILIVSGVKETIGEIIHVNKVACDILGATPNDVLGIDFSNLIPPPFDFKHFTKLKRFLKYATRSQVSSGYVIKLPDGHVKEVEVAVELTAYEGSPVYTVIFKPKEAKREIALISDSGVVYSHTPRFAELLGHPGEKLFWCSIESLVPGFQISKATPNEIWETIVQETRIGITYGYNTIASTTLHYLWLIDDPKQLKKMQKLKTLDVHTKSFNKSELDASFCEDQNFGLWEAQRNEVQFDNETKFISCNGLSEEENPPLKAEGNEELHSNQESSSSARSIRNRKNQRIYDQSMKAIKVFQWILFFCIVVVLLTNSVILFSLNEEINHQLQNDYISKLSQLRSSVSRIGGLARSLHLNYLTQSKELNPVYEKIQQYSESIDQIATLAYIEQFTLCDQSNSKDKHFSMWENYLDSELTKTTFYNSLMKFNQHSKQLLNSVLGSPEFLEEVYFLTVNGQGPYYEDLTQALNNLVECEVENVKQLDTRITIFIAIGLSVLIVCLIILVPNAFKITESVRMFWENLKNLSEASAIELKQASINRLSELHEVKDLELEEKTHLNSKKMEFKGLRKYLVRFCLLALFSVSYYLVSYFVFYNQIKILLETKPSYIKTIANQKDLLSELHFWSREALIHSSPEMKELSLYSVYSFLPFGTSLQSFDRVIQSIDSETDKLFLNQNIHQMGNQTKQLFFDKNDSAQKTLQKGVFQGYLGLVEDYKNLIAEKQGLNELEYYEGVSEEFQEILIEFLNKANSESLEYISENESYLFMVTISYIFLTWVLFWFACIPLLKKEKRHLGYMKQIASLIPSSNLRK